VNKVRPATIAVCILPCHHQPLCKMDPSINARGAEDFPEYLLQKNQLSSEENLGLFKAALNGSVGDCEKWLKRGAKPNFFYRPEDQKNALHVAAEHGFTDVCRLLIKHGAEINSISTTDRATALTLAAHNDDPELIQVLLEAGAQINHGTSET
jgi:ankyrin repeat protein